MRITVPAMSAPNCICGAKMEIYVDLPNKRLMTKCTYCGLEQYESIPFDEGSMTLQAVYDTARSLME